MKEEKPVRELRCKLCDGEWNEYGEGPTPVHVEPIGDWTMFECPRCGFLTQHEIQDTYKKLTHAHGVVL